MKKITIFTLAPEPQDDDAKNLQIYQNSNGAKLRIAISSVFDCTGQAYGSEIAKF